MMNALSFFAVGRGLESDKELVGCAQLPDTGILPLLGRQREMDPETGSAMAGKSVSEPSKSNRSMWRRFVGWIGRSDLGDQADASRPVVAQPELPTVDKPVSEVPDIRAAVDGEPKTEGLREGGRLATLASYNPFGRMEKNVVQTEFRFEKVRVVCNEMHDTDFIIKT